MDGLIFGILRHGFHSGGGQIRKWNVPFYRKLKHRSTPSYWMEPHFRLLWEVPPWD